MRSTVIAFSALAALLTAGAAAAQPVRIVKGVTAFAAPLAAEKVLYQEDDTVLLRTAEAKPDDFQDLYVVNTANRATLPADIADFGEVLAFEPSRFAVMRLKGDKALDLSGRLHAEGHACGILTKLDGTPMSLEAVATPQPLIPVATRDARVTRLTTKVSADRIKATITELSDMPTRYHQSATGQAVADFLAAKYEDLRLGRNDVTIRTFGHGGKTPQKSLIVRIEGATRPTEVIILGSHLDSVNHSGGVDARSPGADDNASGTATNMEVFRLLMEEGIRPERTVEIHAYAAEEAGLVGSQDIATQYKAQGVNVVAMMQHDMDLWKANGAEDKIWFVTSNTESGFNDLLTELAGGYTGLPTAKAMLLGGSSDHASWKRAGYATAFPFENPSSYNRSIHTANDTITNATAFTQAAGFAKLGVAYLMHFGGVN